MESSKRVAAPHQLTMNLDPVMLRGLAPAERTEAITLLAYLLLEASGIVEREADDESA